MGVNNVESVTLKSGIDLLGVEPQGAEPRLTTMPSARHSSRSPCIEPWPPGVPADAASAPRRAAHPAPGPLTLTLSPQSGEEGEGYSRVGAVSNRDSRRAVLAITPTRRSYSPARPPT